MEMNNDKLEIEFTREIKKEIKRERERERRKADKVK